MKTIKISSLVLVLCLVLSIFTACSGLTTIGGGEDTSQGLEFTSNGDGTCYVSGIGTCTDLDVVIPKRSPDGDSVTRIGDFAFNSCSNLASITIPENVTSIGMRAFDSCVRLTSITIPDSVTSIGRSAFSKCRGLTSITIPDSVTSIGNMAFQNCSSLKTVYYTGSEEEWSAIIGSLGLGLTSATIIYNYVPEE